MKRMAASKYRHRWAGFSRICVLVNQVTMAGARVSAVSTLEKKRMRQISQYVPEPPPLRTTKPASMNDERYGPRNPPQRQKSDTSRRLSNLNGARTKNRRTP